MPADPPERSAWRGAWQAAGWCAAIIIVGFALWMLRDDWHAAREALAGLRPDWPLVAAASAAVFGGYLALVWAWRECVRDGGASLTFGEAGRIWFVSNLARYIPGALWQVGALAVLARRQGTSASAATSAAVVLTAINTLCGLAIVLALGAQRVTGVSVPWGGVAAIIVALIGLRWGVPPVLRWLGSTTRWQLRVPAVSGRMLGASIGASAVAWVAYGVAFKLLVDAAFPSMAIGWSAAIAIYAASYLAGFLSLGPPAGIGVAEGAMIYLLTANGIADAGAAAALAAVTRVWRTALEVLPGLVLLVAQPSRGSRIP